MTDADGIAEIFNSMSKRRKVLGGLGTIAAGVVVLGSGNPENELSTAERELDSLSTFINQKDVTDPSNLGSLIDRLNQSLASVNEQLQTDDVSEARNDDSEFKPRILAIEGAVTYYTSLRETLGVSRSLRESLSDSEILLFFDDASQAPAQEQSLSEFDKQITDLNKAIDAETGQNDASLNRLLPDIEVLSQQLQAQLLVYRAHLSMQQSFFTARTQIREGTAHREREEFKEAVEAFETASDTVDVEAPEGISGYSLTFNSASVDQYIQIFNLQSSVIEPQFSNSG